MQTGHVSNERLLMLYGFAISNNPYASVNIYAAMEMESSSSSDGTRYSVKWDALHRMGIPTDASIPFVVDGNNIPASLMVFLRVQHASAEESISVEALLMAATKPLSSGTLCFLHHRCNPISPLTFSLPFILDLYLPSLQRYGPSNACSPWIQ